MEVYGAPSGAGGVHVSRQMYRDVDTSCIHETCKFNTKKYPVNEQNIQPNFELKHFSDKNPTVLAPSVRSGLGGDAVFYFYSYLKCQDNVIQVLDTRCVIAERHGGSLFH